MSEECSCYDILQSDKYGRYFFKKYFYFILFRLAQYVKRSQNVRKMSYATQKSIIFVILNLLIYSS